MDIKCNTGMTEGEEEISWRHKEHDNSIITRVFFITRQYPVGIYRWANFFLCKNDHLGLPVHEGHSHDKGYLKSTHLTTTAPPTVGLSSLGVTDGLAGYIFVLPRPHRPRPTRQSRHSARSGASQLSRNRHVVDHCLRDRERVCVCVCEREKLRERARD